LTNDAGQVIVDPNTGFPLYTSEEQYFGSFQPDFIAGFGTNVGYKGFRFNILFDVKQGGNFVSQTKFFGEFNGTTANTALNNREEYVFPNAVIANADGTFTPNDIPITEQAYFTEYKVAASEYIIDASFMKLREIGLSYQLPKKWLGKHIADASLSVFGKNLRFWLPDENAYADPEINGPALNGNANGIETTQTPTAKSYGVSLKLSF